MVRNNRLLLGSICLLLLAPFNQLFAASQGATPHFVSADSCEDRLPEDGPTTAENRAVDKASLSAIKMAGFIQEAHPDLPPNALDVIAYRIIDEYMMDVTHQVTFSDAFHVCVKMNATVLLTADDLDELTQEYHASEVPEQQIETIAKQIKETTTFKPQNLKQKKLVYIGKMDLWNGAETDNYRDLLTGLLSNSTYFYVTNEEDLADYVLTPRLVLADVSEIDTSNHKMQMEVQLEATAIHDADFNSFIETQTHFILFAADKDEQEIADGLLRKLLTKSADKMQRKLNKVLAESLEQKALNR